MTKEFEDYKMESKRLIDFCRRMMDKRGKRDEYEELEQPQGVPDVKLHNPSSRNCAIFVHYVNSSELHL